MLEALRQATSNYHERPARSTSVADLTDSQPATTQDGTNNSLGAPNEAGSSNLPKLQLNVYTELLSWFEPDTLQEPFFSKTL